MTKTISDFSEVELKAMIYDETQKLSIAQTNIRILEGELAKRAEATKIEPKEVKKSK